MSTSFSTACRATSSGSGTAGRCRHETEVGERRAITFWPRSWPSWPIFAIRMGRRPSRSSNCATLCCTVSTCALWSPISWRYTPDRTDIGGVADRTRFQGVTDLTDGGVARAASTARSSRLPLPSRGGGGPAQGASA